MRKLATNHFMSLDGVIQAPGNPTEDTAGGFKYGGWTVPFWDDAIGEFIGGYMSQGFDLVLGRQTYDMWAGFWPNLDDPMAKIFNDANKYVASRSKLDLEWENSQQLEGDVVEALTALKQTDGPELSIQGSGNLLQSLVGTSVIDEMRIITYPVVLGTGKRLFEPGKVTPTGFKVVSTKSISNGVTMTVLQPNGEPQGGDAHAG